MLDVRQHDHFVEFESQLLQQADRRDVIGIDDGLQAAKPQPRGSVGDDRLRSLVGEAPAGMHRQQCVAQVGADTVINMTGGGQMVLVGVQLSTLPDGWIFGA